MKKYFAAPLRPSPPLPPLQKEAPAPASVLVIVVFENRMIFRLSGCYEYLGTRNKYIEYRASRSRQRGEEIRFLFPFSLRSLLCSARCCKIKKSKHFSTRTREKCWPNEERGKSLPFHPLSRERVPSPSYQGKCLPPTRGQDCFWDTRRIPTNLHSLLGTTSLG